MDIFKGIIFILFFTSIGNFQTFAQSSTWYTGDQKGWLWYKIAPSPNFVDQALEKNEKSHKSTVPSEKTRSESYPYTKRLELTRKNFEEILAKAVLEPTLSNVQLMQQAQNVLMMRGTEFEKLWMLSSLLSGLNYKDSDQSNPQHRKIYQEHMDRELDHKIKHLSKSFGIFFIFKEDCPYCHEFAPTVKKLINIYGFEHKAISKEGKPLPLFPEVEMDNGTIALINPEGIYPSIFLVNPTTKQVFPLGRGLMSLSQLRENFKIIIQYLEETNNG